MRTPFILFALIFLIASTSNAQTSAGNMAVGGQLSVSTYSYQSNESLEYSAFNFSPSFGYFVADNFVAGINLGIGTSNDDDGFTSQKNTSFSVGPFARYYKFTSNEQFAFFAHASLGFSTGKTERTPGGEVKTSSTSFVLSPGVAYFFNEHWGLELSFTGFQISSSDPDKDQDNDKNTNIIFDVRSFSPNIGLRYHF